MKIVVIIFFTTISLFSKPLVTTKYSFYDIYPVNKHKLEDSMDSSSPISSSGIIRHGTVNWKINYEYKRQRKKSLCSILEVKTKVNIIYSVPRIPKNYKTSKGTKKVFNRYYSILKKYLDKHKDYAVEAASEIEKELLKIQFNNDCEVIKKDAKNIAKSITKKYKKKHKDYEIRTYEGFLEGIRNEKLL